MKPIGRKSLNLADHLAAMDRLLEAELALRPTPALVPRGVYKYTSFEEADAHMARMMAETLARHAKKKA